MLGSTVVPIRSPGNGIVTFVVCVLDVEPKKREREPDPVIN
jgi:hypothetical protein